jgi:hypothetical protein
MPKIAIWRPSNFWVAFLYVLATGRLNISIAIGVGLLVSTIITKSALPGIIGIALLLVGVTNIFLRRRIAGLFIRKIDKGDTDAILDGAGNIIWKRNDGS